MSRISVKTSSIYGAANHKRLLTYIKETIIILTRLPSPWHARMDRQTAPNGQVDSQMDRLTLPPSGLGGDSLTDGWMDRGVYYILG